MTDKNSIRRRLRRMAFAMQIGYWNWIFYRRQAFLFEYRLRMADAKSPNENALRTQYECREITPDDLPQCAAIAHLTLVEVQRRFNFGDRCIGVFAGKKLVNVNWLHFGSCYVRGLRLYLELESNDCYLYGVVTDPAHRGRGLFKMALQDIACQLHAQGTINRVLGIVEKGNEASSHALLKAGYEQIADVQHASIFHLRKTSLVSINGHKARSHWHVRRPRDVFWI